MLGVNALGFQLTSNFGKPYIVFGSEEKFPVKKNGIKEDTTNNNWLGLA